MSPIISRRRTIRVQTLLGLCFPFLLHAIGFFSPFWVQEEETSRGLFMYCPKGGSCHNQVLDQPTLGLQATSCIILFFAALSGIISIFAHGPDELDDFDNEYAGAVCIYCNAFCFYYWIVLYPIAAILILSGCINIATQYATIALGVSFYLCLSSSMLTFLAMFVAICDLIWKNEDNESVCHSLLYQMYCENCS